MWKNDLCLRTLLTFFGVQIIIKLLTLEINSDITTTIFSFKN